MKARRYGVVILGMLALGLAGCDNFSLMKQFTLPDATPAALSLAVTKSSVSMGGSVGVSASGGTPPYEFAVAGEDIAPLTASKPVGSVTATAFTSGTAIGKMRITVTDAEGKSAFTYVTVLPPAPAFDTDHCLRTGGAPSVTINLAWSAYEKASSINLFRLEWSENAGPFTSLGNASSSSESYSPMNNLSSSSTFVFRLYAVSGSYESEPAIISFQP